MIYIYDIILNFNKDYYEFFEWKKSDKILNIKKIPAFRVSNKDIRYLKYNTIKVSKEFLNKIFELTLFYGKNNNYKYLCLVSDSTETIGLLFNKNGNLIKKSSLLFDEEEEVNEEIANDKILDIKYLENIPKEEIYISRIEKEKKDYLYKFISTLDLEKDSEIIKYMYYDCYEEEETNTQKAKKIFLKELENNNIDKLYNLVRILNKIKN